MTRLGSLAILLGLTASLPAAPPAAPADAAARVDALLQAELPAAVAADAPPLDDAAWLRRVTLDLVGVGPTPAALQTFAPDAAPDRRQRVVEQLLADRRYGQNWASYWRDVILARRTEDRALIVAPALERDLAAQLNADTPWSQIASEFITAVGDARTNGHTAIVIAQEGQTEDVTAEMSRIFLGVQIQCAQCHDHFTDRWKREEFHELAAFFPRIAAQQKTLDGKRTFVVFSDNRPVNPNAQPNPRRGEPEHRMPNLEDPSAPGTVMTPTFFLTGEEFPRDTPDELRRAAAAGMFLESPWFAKAIVNRMWFELVGEGFYEPVDDLGPDRTCAAPQTMDYLAAQFIAHDYSLKWLLRTITATEVYARPARARRLPTDARLSAACPQRLRSDQLFATLKQALELPEPKLPRAKGAKGNGFMLPAKGLQTTFGQVFDFDPSLPRDDASGSIPQALLLMNSPELDAQLNARGARTMLGRLLREEADDDAVVAELYLRVLGRAATEREAATARRYVASREDRGEAFEDLLWALVNSTEFLHRR